MKIDVIAAMGGDDMYPTMLFDGERFMLVAQEYMRAADRPGHNTLCPNPPRICLGFELVDKQFNKEIFLTGFLAQGIDNHIKQWQDNPPREEDVNAVFESYIELAYLPLCSH